MQFAYTVRHNRFYCYDQNRLNFVEPDPVVVAVRADDQGSRWNCSTFASRQAAYLKYGYTLGFLD